MPQAGSAWLFLLSPGTASGSRKGTQVLVTAALRYGAFLSHDAVTKMINPYETGEVISVAQLRQPREEDRDE